MYCFDTETGALLWTQQVGPFPRTQAEPPYVTPETGFAAPTVAAMGDEVFAVFANGDIAAFDSEGAQLWGRSLGYLENHYGHGSSLMAFDGKVFVQLDDSEQPRLLALDAATGEEVWIEELSGDMFYSSPILVGDRLYILDRAGTMYIMKASAEFELIGSPALGAPTEATPAFMDGRIYLRTEEHLYCIEDDPA